MNQTNFQKLVESSQAFTPENWIAFKALKQLIENETNQTLFVDELVASIQHTDEKFIENQKKSNQEELKQFAVGNKEAVEALLKEYEEKMEAVDVSEIFTETAFYKHVSEPQSTLSSDAKPWSPSLNAAAPVWTPNAEAKAFEFSLDAPEWTPSASSSSLSIEAPEFKPSFSIGAPEFIPQSSSKPLCMPSALGITESIANDSHSSYDSFFDDSPGRRAVSFSELVAPPPVEAKPKVYVCDVDKQTYSLDWLLQVRLEKKFINPAPEIPADVAHPLYRRTEIWTEKQFNPYKYEVNEDVLDDLGKFVTPVFQDEIDIDEVCDPITGMYGVNALKRLQPCYRDIHPALIDKPEILNKDTINNIIMQFMSVGGMNPLFQASLNGVPTGFPPILSPNMDVPTHFLQMLPPAMQQNFMGIFSMIHGGRSGTSSWLDDPEPASPPAEESSPESEDNGASATEESSNAKKESKPSEKPPSSTSPKKKGSKSQRSKSKKSNRVKASRLTKTPEKKAQPKLHKAKNAWTRRGVVDAEEEDLAARTMQSILNKLVPEKFECLLKQALDSKQLVVTKKTTLISLTERLHKKAISEADYAPLYTHFVHKLKLADFESFTENEEETDIETVLLDLCLTRLNAEVELEEGDNEAEKEIKSNRFWKQTLGNYTLLAEIYKRGVLEHEKLSAIVRTLVGIVMNSEEEHMNRAKRVEQLYHVLKACGTEFEEECKERNHFRGDEPHVLESHFLELTKATTDESLQPRVRFMLQDLVELKNKHWESRDRGGMDPKFLSEIREEIRKEQISKKQYLYKLRRQAPAKDRWSKRKSQTPRGTRSSKRRGNHTTRDSPRQRRCLKSLSDSNVLSAASGRKKDSAIPIEKSKRSPKINKIAWAKLVQGHIDENEQPETTTVPVQKAPPVVNAWAKGPPSNISTKDIDTYETKTNISSDPSETLSHSTDSSANESELDDLLIEQKLLEFFENENNGSSLFEELLENGVLPERLIVTVLNVTIQKTDKHRKKLGDLFVQLRNDKVISSEDFLKGFEKASEYFEDWCLDVPKLPEFVKEWLDLLEREDLCKAPDVSFLSSRSNNAPLETSV